MHRAGGQGVGAFAGLPGGLDCGARVVDVRCLDPAPQVTGGQVGQQVGVVRVWRSGNIAVETPVYAAEAVGTGSTMRRAIDGASELVIGMFRAGAEKL